ncbi:MAG: choice-of-anchor J domain-containing protein [Bacteroidetes bacterium]|nr:choice-of-anchor J domain-containing protein [Bacteroidota bacterium]
MKHLFLLALLICNLQTLWAQERCGTVAYETQLAKGNPKRETKQQFEDWIQRVHMAPASKLKTQAKNQTQSTFIIPVVVHVVHNGEPVGTGVNISDAQILSQINVLNNDFNRLNADRTNTPTAFQSVAGSFDVQFVLAKQDPTGIATNGIRRVQGTKTTWSLSDNFQLKSQSYWPAEDYLNVWVCNLTGFLGYTQFPVSTLPGLEGSSNERLTDGIVINYREFGTIDDGPFDLDSRYNKGRTLTHEMGHFFGLRHIWGDGSDCTSTDFVSDTPAQSASTSGCPSHPRLDCGSPQQPRMFQNYLDYTNDACMNLFTQGQVSRMSIVLQNSPRRVSLLLSAGSLPPSTLPNDLGIKNIIAPLVTQCAGSFQPSIQVRNYGTNAITSAQIQLVRNGTPIETISPSLNLLIAQETIITFSTVSLVAGANATFTFNILQTNGTSDGNAQNNSRTVNASAPTVASSLPLFETFASQSNWGIVNPDGLTTWQTVTTPSGKTAAYLDFYDYAEVGATDLLTSPVIDLTSSTKATLIFERAYAPYPGVTGERLRVLATTNCNFTNAVELFSKSDDELATTDFDYNNYTPLNNAQWVTEVVPLDGFLGGSVQVAFEGTNANGNNLYITNVRIVNTNWLDVALVKMLSPSPVSCVGDPSPTVLVKNIGNVPITSFSAAIVLNGQSLPLQSFNQSLAINEQKIFNINPIDLSNGSNSISISVQQPNGTADNVLSNNNVNQTVVLNTQRDVIPLRERFDSDTKNNWTILSQPSQASWQLTSTNYKNSLVYNCFTNGQRGDESWLVSPVLDFRNASQASLFFNISYAKAQTGSESLRLLASTDCGLTFTSVLYNQSGSGLTSQINNANWVPTSPSDWRKQYINLNDYAGQEQVRFAFVVTNGNGNNLYLDNIDLYTSSNANPIVPDELYSIYGGLASGVKVTFNLDARADVRLAIYNSVGQIVSTFNYSDVLNQTYPIELGERSQGVYIVQVQIGNSLSAKRVFFGN